jgi:hypothetical protein
MNYPYIFSIMSQTFIECLLYARCWESRHIYASDRQKRQMEQHQPLSK